MVSRVSMAPSLHCGQVLKEQADGMQGHAVADGVVPGGVDRLDGDTQLSDRGRHQDPPRRGGQGLSVDEHRAGGHAVTGQAELATQVVIGDPPAAATELGAAHGGGHAEDRQLGRQASAAP